MRSSPAPAVLSLLWLLGGVVACDTAGGDAAEPADTDVLDTGGPQGWTWDLPPGFPPPAVPDDNRMSRAKAELGRHLFYDERLSFNETMACASCHLPEHGFAFPAPLPTGATGVHTPRSAPGLQNAAYYATFTWANPTLLDLESQLLIPMFGEFPIELGITGHEDEVLGRLRADDALRTRFERAFPDADGPMAFDHIVKALATFVRSMVSWRSPYDRYVYYGDDDAMSADALRGMDHFFSETFECHHCHGGYHLSRSVRSAASTHYELAFDNTGLYDLDGLGSYPPDNPGLFEFSSDPADMGRFRPPSLRNVALTAPYAHDGSIESLREVLQVYADAGRVIEEGPYAGDGRTNPHKSGFVIGFDASEQQIDELMAFLESLTDEAFLTDPRFADPADEGPQDD